MKNWSALHLLMAAASWLLITACEKQPEVFSFNNFSSALIKGERVKTVAPFSAKGIEGTWSGMGHEIEITPGTSNHLNIYIAALIDTNKSDKAGIDTTSYSILLITVAGHRFAEVISEGSHINAHDFMIPVSTWLKINKLSWDTIIVQMPASKFASSYMKANNYSYFIPAEYKNEKEFPVYITEDPDRLAALLNNLWKFPAAFQPPDTLLRKH